MFRVLDRESSGGSYRVVRLATWCDPQGQPILCQGTLRRLAPDSNKGRVYVPLIRREITLQPTDFVGQTLRINEPLYNFHIAFNFGGPIADPSRFYKA